MKTIKKVIGDTTDCQTEEGITVSLIDTISFLLGQLSKRNLESVNVKEAIKDFQTNGKFNIGSKVYTIFISDVTNKIKKTPRDYTVDEREVCSNCKRKINTTEQVFRVADYSPKPFVVKGQLNRKKREMVTELNKLNHCIYCSDCTNKFDVIIAQIK